MNLIDKIDANTAELHAAEAARVQAKRDAAEAKTAAIVSAVKKRIRKLAQVLEVEVTFLPFSAGYTLYANLGGLIIEVSPPALNTLYQADITKPIKVGSVFQVAIIGMVVGEQPRLMSKALGTLSEVCFDAIANSVRQLSPDVDIRSIADIQLLLFNASEAAAEPEQEFIATSTEELDALFDASVA